MVVISLFNNNNVFFYYLINKIVLIFFFFAAQSSIASSRNPVFYPVPLPTRSSFCTSLFRKQVQVDSKRRTAMTFWLIIGITSAFLGLAGLVVLFLRLRANSHSQAPAGAEPEIPASGGAAARPTASLRRRAWWGLGTSAAILLAIAGILAGRGVNAYEVDLTTRIAVTVLFFGALAANAALLRRPGRGADRGYREIMSQAPAAQSTAVALSLMSWAIVLAEIYWEEGAIPIVFPYLMALSGIAVNILAMSVKILIGCGRQPRIP
jgi:hypothetical protein